jgi:hypothetical protein
VKNGRFRAGKRMAVFNGGGINPMANGGGRELFDMMRR